MENYNAGIEIDREYFVAYLMRGKLFLKQNENLLAEADFEEVLKLDTVVGDGSCRHYALHFIGRDDEALEWMAKMIIK